MRELKIKPITYGENAVTYYELAGLSTETKPTSGVATGSIFLEVDTGDVYAFDETGSGTWYKICSLGGGA